MALIHPLHLSVPKRPPLNSNRCGDRLAHTVASKKSRPLFPRFSRRVATLRRASTRAYHEGRSFDFALNRTDGVEGRLRNAPLSPLRLSETRHWTNLRGVSVSAKHLIAPLLPAGRVGQRRVARQRANLVVRGGVFEEVRLHPTGVTDSVLKSLPRTAGVKQ